MYRCSVDNAITYTAEDFILFMESPFASWMERLTLENPDHGIMPDPGSEPPGKLTNLLYEITDTSVARGRGVESVEWQDFVLTAPPPGVKARQWPDKLSAALGLENSDIAFVEARMDESERRAATLEAMRRGADFVVNGQLVFESLSGPVNLLMRSSGSSELGNYLYIPCDTQPKTSLHSAFHLCYAADLLQRLQGKLPPQMLIIRNDVDILPLETQSHIYHYRAVKQRFLAAQFAFRKHCMPDPADSAHFGRWSHCANAVLKQRAVAKESQALPEPDDSQKSVMYNPAPVSAEAPSPRLRQQPAIVKAESAEITGTRVSPNKQSLVDLDTPTPLDARLITAPLVETLPLSPEPDNAFGELVPPAFDSTLRTSEGGE